MTVMVAQGNACIKAVNGQECEVIPFTGADHEGEISSYGVGYMLSNEQGGSLWGLAAPQLLIQSWRAMKLLEYVFRIDDSTLCACWYAANRNVHECERQLVYELAQECSALGPGTFDEIRSQILDSVPSTDELDRMLTVVRDKNIEVSAQELTELVESGALPAHPIIDELVRREEQKRGDYEARETFLSAAMPSEQSLGDLFAELGITNMLDGIPFGGYGLDWGHIDLARIDYYVKQASTGRYGEGHQFQLRHTTERAETVSDSVAPGVTMFQTSFGKIEEPWIVALNGIKYTFLSAAYSAGSIMVKTRVERPNIEPIEGVYSVLALRVLIGEVQRSRRRRLWFLAWLNPS